MLQAFLQHHIYFLLMKLNLILHLRLRSSIFSQYLHQKLSSSRNFQHVSSPIEFCLFLMTLINVILPHQLTPYVTALNILMDAVLLLLVYLKFCPNNFGTLIFWNFFECFLTRNVFDIICCIDMDNFSVTFKADILVSIW